MRIGDFNRQVTIERPLQGQDETGQPISTWTFLATVWANIAQKSGLETIRADAPVSLVQASIRIRYRTDIDAGMRVVFGTTLYDIRAVLPDSAGRKFVDLVCEAGARR